MTRINVGINPKYLTDEHLIAEHREIKRICSLFRKRRENIDAGKKVSDLPGTFSLGKGHVLFFMYKPNYTYKRYKQLHKECLKRGLDVTDFRLSWAVYWLHFNKSGRSEWSPKPSDVELLVKRIRSNLSKSTANYHYYRKPVTIAWAKKYIKKALIPA